MRYAQLIFSPTGGTQKVAKAITEKWGADVETVDLTDAAADFSGLQYQKGDLVLIAVPSFGGRVPATAVQRLEQIQGNGADSVLVCVYGNRAYEDTLIELKDTAEKCGFQTLAAIAAIAEHSIMHQYAANRPDAQDIADLQEASGKILEKFQAASDGKSVVQVPGERPYKKTKGGGMVPKAGKECTGCGLCAAQCPTQAIDREKLREADAKRCISCMRCVVKCPHSARGVNREMVAAAALMLKKACSVPKKCELFI
ncbi:MAG: 4Fe-4S binding protein [Provencibacterium sp.]|jgi:ferredoxin|nr:4Fe-4S binding protein [Provencibacterium sp.]